MKRGGNWKKAGVVLGLGAAVSVAALTLISKKFKAPIHDVSWNSTPNGHLVISWYDQDGGETYSVYWSNKKGINVMIPETYRHCIKCVTMTRIGDEIHHSITIKPEFEWVYFVIAKRGHFTKEFEANVQHNSSSDSHFDRELIHRDPKAQTETYKLSVSEGVSKYKLFRYLEDDTVEIQKIPLSSTKNVDVKICTDKTCMYYIATKKEKTWSLQKFFLLVEKFDLPE